MIETILKAASIPCKPSRYAKPPANTYAVYFDDQTVDGPDPTGAAVSLVVQHDVTVELYEPTQDPAIEAALEAELAARGIIWTKQARYWLQNVQRYQVIYEFTYIEKRRLS